MVRFPRRKGKGTYVLGNGCRELLSREFVCRIAIVIEVSSRSKDQKDSIFFHFIGTIATLLLVSFDLSLSLSLSLVHVLPSKHRCRFVL